MNNVSNDAQTHHRNRQISAKFQQISAKTVQTPPTCGLLVWYFFEADGDRVCRCWRWLCLRLSCGWLLAIWPNEWLDDDEEWCRCCMPASNNVPDWNHNKIISHHLQIIMSGQGSDLPSGKGWHCLHHYSNFGPLSFLTVLLWQQPKTQVLLTKLQKTKT